MPVDADELRRQMRMGQIFRPTNPIQVGPNLETGQGTFTGRPMIGPQGQGGMAPMQAQIGERFKPPTQVMQNAPEQDPFARISAAYMPDTRFSDMYEEELGRFPQRNKPSTLRKITAMFAGSPEEAEKVMYAPYNREMADWQARAKAIEPALTAERYANTNERYLMTSALQGEAAARRATVAEDAERRRREQGEESLRIQQQRVNIQQHRAEHPDWIMSEDVNGNVFAMNPQTREVDYVVDALGNPVKSSAMSDFDRIRTNFRNRLQLERVLADYDAKQDERNAAAAKALQEQRARDAERLKQTPSVPEGSVEELTREVNVERDAQGNPIRGTTTQQTRRVPGPGQRVRMIDPRGRLIWVPITQVPEALSRGAKYAETPRGNTEQSGRGTTARPPARSTGPGPRQ